MDSGSPRQGQTSGNPPLTAPTYSYYPYPPNYGQPQAVGVPVYQQPQVVVVHDQYQPMMNRSMIRDGFRRVARMRRISFCVFLVVLALMITGMVVFIIMITSS